MDKNTLRKVYLQKRKTLTDAEYQRRNELLVKKIHHFVKDQDIKNLHLFLPIAKNREPDLTGIINLFNLDNSEMKFIVSISDLDQPVMKHYLLSADTELIINKWGIPEPVNAEPFDISKLHCVLVPMTIGSKTGQRIGYGKGYYDHFLAGCPKDCLFVGVNLGPLLDGDIFAEPHDMGMDYMITPFEITKIGL